MRIALACVATVVVAWGCESQPASPPAASPPQPITAAQVPTPAPAPVVEPPRAPGKQLITITTKSPDAKAMAERGFVLAINGRTEEALEQCRQAVAADADFAFGHMCMGALMPGAAAQAELDKGAELAAKLPEAERLFIESFASARRMDIAGAHAKVKRVAELAPDDFRVMNALGGALSEERDFRGAASAFAKAIDLEPTNAAAYSALSWIHVQLREYDDALGAAKKYVEVAPSQPNAHQTLASALLNVNQPKDAEGELAKAVELGPKVRQAYYDLAAVKTLNGDFAGARDALERSKASEVQPTDAVDRAVRTAWTLLAQGKQAEAFTLLGATEKDSDARKLPWPALPASTRAWATLMLGKPADAEKIAVATAPRCDHAESSAAYRADCARDLLTIQAFAQIQTKRAADAQKTIAKLRDVVSKSFQGNDWVQLQVGILSDQAAALAGKDAKAAAAVLAKCPPDDVLYKLGVLRQAQAAGDKDGAEQVRKDLLGRPQTDPSYALAAKVAAK